MIKRFTLVGDSLTYASSPNGPQSLTRTGGRGTWGELAAEGLANLSTIGPLLSAGFQSVWYTSGAPGTWTLTGTWSSNASTDAWDRGPYGLGKYGANGSTHVASWAKPSQWRAVVGFEVYFGDYTGGGNFQYRVDGGTWTNMSQTLAHDNLMGKFYVPTAVTSTIELRQYNGASSVGCCIFGITPWFVNPLTATDGLVFDNIACGGQALDDLTVATSGDRMAFFDSVKVDPVNGGGAISNQPNAGVVMMHINDARLFTVAEWAADIATFYARVSPLAPLAYMSYGEMNATGYDPTTQADFRAQTKTSAALHSLPVLDFYDIWTANGWGTGVGTQNAALMAAGLVSYSVSPTDNGHQTQAGHIDMAPRAYWFIRNRILGLGAVPTAYPVASKQTDVTYTGSEPAVAYAAGLPVMIE